MNSTPLWLPLAIAGIGLLGTIMGTVTGVLIAQRRSDRREREIWQRERDRERQLWAREDALRNFEQRRDTYVSFYETLRQAVLKVYDHGMGLSVPPPEEDEGELPFEWNQEIAHKLQHLQIFASPQVLAAADNAYNACWRWGHVTKYGIDDDTFYERQEDYNSNELVLYDSIRRDLGMAGVLQDGRPIPGSGWAVDGGE